MHKELIYPDKAVKNQIKGAGDGSTVSLEHPVQDEVAFENMLNVFVRFLCYMQFIVVMPIITS